MNDEQWKQHFDDLLERKHRIKNGMGIMGLPPKRLAFITASGTEVVLWEKDIVAVERFKDIELHTNKETWCYWVYVAERMFCTFSPLFAPYFEEPRS